MYIFIFDILLRGVFNESQLGEAPTDRFSSRLHYKTHKRQQPMERNFR